MKNHVHTSLSRPLIIAGVSFEWFVFEALTTVLTINWFKTPITILVLLIVSHIIGILKTVKDPQWVKIMVVRLRYFEKTGREKRFTI